MSQTLSAIASLLWPLIVLAIIVVFRGPLSRVIKSTETRDVTIKIAGQEVTLGELHRQQMDMMSDVHEQIASLHKEITGKTTAAPQSGAPAKTAGAPRVAQAVPVKAPAFSGAAAPATPPAVAFDDTDTEPARVPVADRPDFHADPVKAPWERLEHHEPAPAGDKQAKAGDEPAALSVVPAPSDDDLVPGWTGQQPDTRPKAAGVLWVEDHPERQALQIDQLERRGVVVDVVRTTKEALQKLTGQRYQLIVSDMERVEGGKPVPNAGLELIRTVRTFDRDTPVVIYASGPGGRVLGDTATQIGADLVTNSWYQLTREMHRVGVL
ncbi:MAG TPA: response regulator [Pseudonocardiaceae bacterium]|nr:response regulator [Pseudonocardiaceae bacterium]